MLGPRKWNSRHSSLLFCNLLLAGLAVFAAFLRLCLCSLPSLIPDASCQNTHPTASGTSDRNSMAWVPVVPNNGSLNAPPQHNRTGKSQNNSGILRMLIHYVLSSTSIRIRNLQYTLRVFLANVNLDIQSKYLFKLRQSTSIMTLEFQDNVNFFLLFWACTVAPVKAFSNTNMKYASGNKFFIHGC